MIRGIDRGRLIFYLFEQSRLGRKRPNNNGNLLYQETWVPPANQVGDEGQFLIQDTYSYDALNRLDAVNESSLNLGGGGSWQNEFTQDYDYDRWGNLEPSIKRIRRARFQSRTLGLTPLPIN